MLAEGRPDGVPRPALNPLDGSVIGNVTDATPPPTWRRRSPTPGPGTRPPRRARRRSAGPPTCSRRTRARSSPCLRARRARPCPTGWASCARPWTSCATTPPGSRASRPPRAGVFACVSPWNFPLAIFTGQVAAALACGNAGARKARRADAARCGPCRAAAARGGGGRGGLAAFAGPRRRGCRAGLRSPGGRGVLYRLHRDRRSPSGGRWPSTSPRGRR